MKNRSFLRAVLFAGALSLVSGFAPALVYAEVDSGRGDSPRTEWIIQRQSSRLEAARQQKVDEAEAERIKLEKMEREREDIHKENQCQNC